MYVSPPPAAGRVVTLDVLAPHVMATAPAPGLWISVEDPAMLKMLLLNVVAPARAPALLKKTAVLPAPTVPAVYVNVQSVNVLAEPFVVALI